LEEQRGSDGFASPFGKRTSLRSMSPSLSRKEKIEVFEMKMNEFDDIIPSIEENVSVIEATV
jgi:hypothetical protein